jgi:hypothetical protein
MFCSPDDKQGGESTIQIQKVARKSADVPTAKGDHGVGVSAPVAALSAKLVTVPALPFAT